MKLLFTLTFVAIAFFNIGVHSQIKGMTKMNTFDIGIGQKFLHKDFYNQLGTFKDVKVLQPLSYIGFGGYSGFARDEKSFYSGHFFYQQVIPQSVTIQDSIKGKITGFNFALTLMGKDLLGKSEQFDMLVGFGISTGRLRMYKDDLLKQKNPYFAPKISLTPRAKLGKVVISLNLDYEFDVSRPGWRSTVFSRGGDKVNLGTLRQSGLNGFLTVGRFIGDSSKGGKKKN